MKGILFNIIGLLFYWVSVLLFWGSILALVGSLVLGIDISLTKGFVIVLTVAGITFLGIPLILLIILSPFVLFEKIKKNKIQ